MRLPDGDFTCAAARYLSKIRELQHSSSQYFRPFPRVNFHLPGAAGWHV